MKFSAILALLVLGSALAWIVAGDPAAMDQESSQPPVGPEASSNGPSSENTPTANSTTLPPEGMRYLGHDWVEVVEVDNEDAGPAPRPSSLFSKEAAAGALTHPSHRTRAACRVCELIRIMNRAW